MRGRAILTRLSAAVFFMHTPMMAQIQSYSVRSVIYPVNWSGPSGNTVPETVNLAFLDRAKRNGYNYVEFHFGIGILSSGTFVPPGGPLTCGIDPNPVRCGLRENVESVLNSIRASGLRLIPVIGVGSKHDTKGWGWLNDSWPGLDINDPTDPQMNLSWELNPTTFLPDIADPTKALSSTSFAPDPNMDAAFLSVVNTIKSAFAVNNDPLDYIHLGHDEVYASAVFSGPGYWYNQIHLMIGWGGPHQCAGNQCVTENHPGFSQLDRDFICSRVLSGVTIPGCGAATAGLGKAPSLAFQEIMSREIHSRINTIKGLFPTNTPKVIINGDMWDPSVSQGGSYAHTFLGVDVNPQDGQTDTDVYGNPIQVKVRLTEPVLPGAPFGIASLPGLSVDEASLVRQHLIVRPWAAEGPFPVGEPPITPYGLPMLPYNAEGTMNYLSNAGVNFMVSLVYSSNGACEEPIGAKDTVSVRLGVGYFSASRKYSSKAFGYTAAIWPFTDGPYDPTLRCTRVIEYARRMFDFNQTRRIGRSY